MMIIKEHKSAGRGIVIALCDKDLLGNVFEDGEKILDISGDFYAGKEVSAEDAIKIIREGYILNIVGKESVDFAINKNLVDKDHIAEIKGVPYAQVLIIRD